MRRISKKSAAFDVPEQYKPQMDKLIADCQNEQSYIKDYEVLVVNSMEMLSDDEEEKQQEPDEDFDDRDVNNAMRNKRDYEVFIGCLPSNADERELGDFFKNKKVKITNLRILRSTPSPMQTTKASPSASASASASTTPASNAPSNWTARSWGRRVSVSTWPPRSECCDVLGPSIPN
jgi:hypothetical protein